MNKFRSPKRLVVLILLSASLVFVFAASTHRWFKPGWLGNGVQASASSQRKVLYWYDAMTPQHHYNHPGKAPDGMDLVPAYDQKGAPPKEQPPSGTAASPNSKSSDRSLVGGTSMPGMASKEAPGGGRKVSYWYDAMAPQHHYDGPGKAPDGMDLLPSYAESAPGLKNMPTGTVVIPPEKQVLAGVRTSVVERRPLVREIHTTAQIVADETKIAHIHVKVAGYIDKVYVDFVGQLVKKGQPIFTLYSPDLVSTEEEYLIAKRGNTTLGSAPFAEVAEGAQSLLRSTRERLKLWDISEDQIRQLDESGKISKELTFYSPTTGFVTDRKVFPQTSVTTDTELYTISDLSTVWAEVAIYEYEVPFVHMGQKVALTLSYYPGKTYTGVVSYIYPTVDAQSRTIKVRVQLPNPGFALKPQMFADAQLRVNYGTKILVPQEAVLDSGSEQRVFVVHPGGVFEPRRVTLGPAMDGNVAILSGLKTGETVVTSGNFLIDSESGLKNAMSGMKH